MAVKLQFGNKNIPINIIWLRDNCRCLECYDHENYSRKKTIQDFLKTIRVNVHEYVQKEDELYVEWSDGHKSTYLTKWVIDMWTRNGLKVTPHPCSGDELAKLPAKVSFNDLAQIDCLKELIKSILKYGVGIVTDVEPTLNGTEKVVRFIAQPEQTLFGGMWTVGGNENHKDPAFLKGPLAVHNDSTYLCSSTGLQVFHMIERDSNGEGGLSTAVDGFKAAEILKQSNPLHFQNLVDIEIESEYKEPGSHCKCTGPVIKVNRATNEVYQIRFNIWDRSPLPPSHNIEEFYESYAHFAEILEREELYWKYKLQPGTVVIFNNWRVMHGRTSFTGKRVLGGCYVSMTDFLSKARTLQLIS